MASGEGVGAFILGMLAGGALVTVGVIGGVILIHAMEQEQVSDSYADFFDNYLYPYYEGMMD
jgi:hypothetical protein